MPSFSRRLAMERAMSAMRSTTSTSMTAPPHRAYGPRSTARRPGARVVSGGCWKRSLESMERQMWGNGRNVNGEDSGAASDVNGPMFATSAVKISCFHSEPNCALPWQRHEQYSSFSSGVIIEPGYVLTNAHCVQHGVLVQVRKCGNAGEKYQAKILHLVEECDLALLYVPEPEFHAVDDADSGVEWGSIPKLSDKVTVVGFPIGGSTLSFTSGVVSRIETSSYAHAGVHNGVDSLLTLQIDAAVNSGNSGGPVFDIDGRCVGLAFQSLGGESENVGYVIPVPVIFHFLRQAKLTDEALRGFPRLGISAQALESPAMRRRLGLAEDQSGVYINRVWRNSCSDGKVLPGDVLMAVDGTRIANDGTVAFRTGERISFRYLVGNKFIGEECSAQIFRPTSSVNGSKSGSADKGMVIDVNLTLSAYEPRVPTQLQQDSPPSYVLVGGLVFVVLTEPLLLGDFGEGYAFEASIDVLKHVHDPEKIGEREQIIVLRQVLASPSTIGFEDFEYSVLESLNGVEVRSIEHLARLLASSAESFLSFTFQGGLEICLDANEVDAATQEAMHVHHIPAMCSPDILFSLSLDERATASSEMASA